MSEAIVEKVFVVQCVDRIGKWSCGTDQTTRKEGGGEGFMGTWEALERSVSLNAALLGPRQGVDDVGQDLPPESLVHGRAKGGPTAPVKL